MKRGIVTLFNSLFFRMEVKKKQEKMEARRDLEKNIDIIQSPLARNKEQVI